MRILLIALIIIIAAGAGFAVLQMSQPAPQVNTVVEEEPEIEAVNVLVARDPIPVGTVITEQMVDQQPWPKHLVLSGFVTADSEETRVVGMVARSDFQSQEPLNRFKLANPNDANFIAAALPEGMRALTLAVDAISGVAGYVFAGDRVDIIMTHRIPVDLANANGVGANGSYGGVGFAETVMSNIKVLAVDIRGAGGEEGRGQRVPTNLTVEVTPEQAQGIRLAEANGDITMALRPLKREDDEPTVTTVKDLTGASIAGKDGRDEVFVVRGVNATGVLAAPGFGGSNNISAGGN